MNLSLLIQMAADTFGEREAVVLSDRRLTFADICNASGNLAEHLSGSERLAYLAETRPAFPIGLFAAARAGIPFVPINYRLAGYQIDGLLSRVKPATLVTEKSISQDGLTTMSPLESIAKSGNGGADLPEPENDVAIELFTSGTTGEPKSAVLRHSNIMAYILGTVEFMSAGEEEATLISVPPYHIAGISAVLSSTYAGRRMVQLPNFTPEGWLAAARSEQVTHAFVVPTMLQRVIEHLNDTGESFELPALRALAYGGGKMPKPVIEKAMDMLPDVNFTNAYGLTETSSTICLLGPEDHRDAFGSDDPMVRRRLGSVGKALPFIELEIRDDAGVVQGPEEAGLIFVRGDQVAGEYKKAGSQLDADGWFPTKDRGFLDADGFLYLDGRDDDIIVRGGENISPGEVEDVLLTHPGVREVAVVAVPDTEWGEAVGAVIVPNDGPPLADALKELVRSNLRSSRVPSVIEFVDELPYNDTGKLMRRLVRDRLAN